MCFDFLYNLSDSRFSQFCERDQQSAHVHCHGYQYMCTVTDISTCALSWISAHVNCHGYQHMWTVTDISTCAPQYTVCQITRRVWTATCFDHWRTAPIGGHTALMEGEHLWRHREDGGNRILRILVPNCTTSKNRRVFAVSVQVQTIAPPQDCHHYVLNVTWRDVITALSVTQTLLPLSAAPPAISEAPPSSSP